MLLDIIKDINHQKIKKLDGIYVAPDTLYECYINEYYQRFCLYDWMRFIGDQSKQTQIKYAKSIATFKQYNRIGNMPLFRGLKSESDQPTNSNKAAAETLNIYNHPYVFITFVPNQQIHDLFFSCKELIQHRIELWTFLQQRPKQLKLYLSGQYDDEYLPKKKNYLKIKY